MTYYKIQPGIVLTTVCGENLLVATRKARKVCPYIKQINDTAAFYWNLLEQERESQMGLEFEQMVEAASVYYNVEADRIGPGLQKFLNQMIQSGYLISEELS